MPERARLSLLACLSSVCLLVTPEPSLAEQNGIRSENKPKPLTCAQRYHRRLTSEVLPLVQQTQSVADAMRKARSPSMPGRWLFWEGSTIPPRTLHQQRLLATPLVRPEANLICARQVLVRGGRIHCRKWNPIPPGYKPPAFKPAKTPDKQAISHTAQRIAAELSRLVISKGAFPELEKGSSLYHRLQRTTDELLTYAAQHFRPTLCTGAQEMVGFYKRQLAPLISRTRKFHALFRTFRETRRRNAPSTQLLNIGQNPPNLETNSEIPLTIERLHTAYKELKQSNELGNRQTTKEQLKTGKYQLQFIELDAYAKHHLQHYQRLHSSFQIALSAISAAHSDECTC